MIRLGLGMSLILLGIFTGLLLTIKSSGDGRNSWRDSAILTITTMLAFGVPIGLVVAGVVIVVH